MALQFPGQFNQLNMPAIDQAVQQKEWNALRNEAAQQNIDAKQGQLDDNKRIEISKFLVDLGKLGSEGIQSDPGWYSRMLPQIHQEFSSRGIPTDKIPPAGTSPEQLLEDFQEMQEIGQLGLGGPQDREVIKGADGYNYYKDTGERVLPNVEKSAPNVGITGSLQEVEAINAARAARGEQPIDPEEYLSSRRQNSADLQRYNQYVNDTQAAGRAPMSEQEFAATRAGGISGSQTRAKGEEQALREYIDVGQRQADATVILRRGIQLLDMVDTGKPEQVALAARNWFGVAGADETELSANLGKAILSQLRQTFGAQFTQQEGERLEYIEANYGKSTAGNKRLLAQALKISERAARRGLDAAKKADDPFAAQEIERSLNFNLEPAGSDDAFQKQWDAARPGEVLQAPDGTFRRKP